MLIQLPQVFPIENGQWFDQAAGEALTSTNPRGRLGEKEDIQSLLIFLCSKQSNYVNGIIVPLDGGAHNNQPAAHF